MKAYLINMHLLVPRSRSFAKVKIKYKGYISQKMAVFGAFMFHEHILFLRISKFNPLSSITLLILSKRLILHSSKLNESADDNFKFDENGRKFSEWVENTGGKGEIARYEQFLFFLQYFQKTCNADR